MSVNTIDVYSKDGDLIRIEAYKESGEFLIQFLWDEHDSQTSENRVEFRKWVKRHLKQSGHEVSE